MPRHLFIVGARDVPRTATGKVDKTALRFVAEALVVRDRREA